MTRLHPVPDDRILHTVAGLPITGRIVTVPPAPPQRTLADLEQLIGDTLAGDEQLVEIGWLQYSPYLGDSVWGRFWTEAPWVRTIHDLAEPEDPEDPDEVAELWGIKDSHPSIGERSGSFNPERWTCCETFAQALLSREYDDALLSAFGDCAAITITVGTGITVREYIGELGY